MTGPIFVISKTCWAGSKKTRKRIASYKNKSFLILATEEDSLRASSDFYLFRWKLEWSERRKKKPQRFDFL